MPKTANERLATKKDPKVVVLEKDFAGIRKGSKLFVGTPQIIAEYLSSIPYGETRTIPRMRSDLAQRRKCDATCPVSTSIFIRIASQAAIEDMNAGKPVDAVIPFWRLLSSDEKIAKKLPIDGAWLDTQRELEAAS